MELILSSCTEGRSTGLFNTTVSPVPIKLEVDGKPVRECLCME